MKKGKLKRLTSVILIDILSILFGVFIVILGNYDLFFVAEKVEAKTE